MALTCRYLEGGLAFRYGSVASCGVIHHGRGTPPLANFEGGKVNFKRLFKRRAKIANGSSPMCRGCPNLVEAPETPPVQPYPITWLGITHFNYCNVQCTYCWLQTSAHSPIKTGDWEMTYRILPIVKQMLAENLLAPDAIIDWGGGGEPTLMPDFDEAFALLDEHGTTQWLHSNAVRIPTRAKSGGMEKSRVRILCSLDSGYASTYYEIKNKDHFDTVCQNLATYAANGAYVAVKYIMMDINSDFDEIETCLQMMKAAGCAEFVPDIDHDVPDPSEKVIRGLAFARRRCAELGIPYQLGSTGINNAREYLVGRRVENEYYRLAVMPS